MEGSLRGENGFTTYQRQWLGRELGRSTKGVIRSEHLKVDDLFLPPLGENLPDEVVPDDTSPCETQSVGILFLLKPGVRGGPKKSVQSISMHGSRMKQEKLWKDRSQVIVSRSEGKKRMENRELS